MKNMKCPVTGVSIPYFALSLLCGFAFVFACDFVVHGMLLMPTYQLTPQLWRTPQEMTDYQTTMMGFQFLLVFVTALLYTRNHEGKGVMEGLRFGVLLGALMGVMMSGSYSWMPISTDLALSWFAAGFAKGVGLGVIYSLTYKACGMCGKNEGASCSMGDKSSA